MSIFAQYPIIRSYRGADAAATLKVFNDAITISAASDYSPEQLVAWVQPGTRSLARWHKLMLSRNSFVAVVYGEIAGFSDVAANGHIEMLFVAPHLQRRGIARALLGVAEHQAAATAAKSLTADVSITARPLFEACGFTVVQQQNPVRQGVQFINFRMRKVL